MKFNPKTENEIKAEGLLPAGEYDFEVGTAIDATSSKGNDMIKLDLTVFDANGNKRFVFDYLLEAMAFKLRHAAEACGLLAKYEAGSLEADDFIGKSGKVKLAIDDKNKDFPPKNVVKDYIVADKPRVQKTIDEALGGDELPDF